MELTAYNTSIKEYQTWILKFDPSEIRETNESYNFQIIAKKYLENHIRCYSEETKDSTDNQVEISTKYSVLCNKTAFVGIVKNKSKSTKEMKRIDIPIKKLGRYDYDSCDSSFRVDQCKLVSVEEEMSQNKMYNKQPMIWGAEEKSAGKIQKQCENINENVSVNKSKNESKEKEGFFRSMFSCLFTKSQKKHNLKEKYEMNRRERIEGNNELDQAIERNDYFDVAKFQNAEGYFTDLPSKYSQLLSISIPESIVNQASSKEKSNEIWITILAICILDKYYKDSKSEWIMIEKKSLAYLKSLNSNGYLEERKHAADII